MPLVTLEEIRRARSELPPEVELTPVLPALELSERFGVPIRFKAESLQVTGSYKVRAAFTVLNRLSPEARERGAAISSSGNFASAWAFMARLLGIPAAVVMQEQTSPLKLEKTRRYGAEAILVPNDFETRWARLFALESERGMTVVNTFESPDVLRGHGTIGLEIMDQFPDVSAVLVPVSSAGLIAGLAVAVKSIRPSVRVIGVQPEGSRAAYDSFQAGEVRRSEPHTICDALVAAYPGALPFEHMQRYVDEIVLVSEESVRQAVRWLAEREKLVVEAGGAVGTAALLTGAVEPRPGTVVLLSGGNIHPATLAEYLTA